MLNAILGEVVFKSGVKFGSGLTTSLQRQAAPDGTVYVDTPGLDDLERRGEAAKEINRMLQCEDGSYKLVFIVTVEAGRIRLTDLTTMKLVLNALPNTKDVPFSIVVNKVSSAMMDKLQNQYDLNELISSFQLGEGYYKPWVVIYPKIDLIEDVDDALHTPAPVLREFLDSLESVVVKSDQVKDIEYDTFEAVYEKLKTLQAEHEKLASWEHKWHTFGKGFGVGVGVVGGLVLLLIPK